MVTNGLALSAQHSTGTVVGGTVLTGMVIVFAVLLILIGVMYLLGLVSRSGRKSEGKEQRQAPASAAPSPAVLVPAAAVTEEEETVAVIAAAVGAYMADSPAPYAITSVTRAKDARPVWGFAGMTQNTRPF